MLQRGFACICFPLRETGKLQPCALGRDSSPLALLIPGSFFGSTPAGIRLHLLSLAGDGKANRGIHQRARWFMHTPPCGARKTVRAYATPPVFRPLRKLRLCFLCHRQHKAEIPPACADMIRIPAERQKRRPPMGVFFFGAPAGIRTPDTLLKRQVLCLLSYWGVAGMAGLEPTISESKSGVLPLHYIPLCRTSC